MSGDLDALLGLGDQSFRKTYYPELQRSMSQLEQEREKFRTIFNNSVQLIGLLDTQGVVLEANARALQYINAKPEDVIGKPFWDTAWWKDQDEGIPKLKAAIAAALTGEIPHFETTHPAVNGIGRAIMEFTITPLRDASGRITLLIPEGRDITERKTAEAERISALGQLVVGISHEINTPLGVSLTAISFLREKLSGLASTGSLGECMDSETLLERLTELAKAADMAERNMHKAASLIQSFKNIAVDQQDEKQRVFNLWDYLQDIARSAQGLLEPGRHHIAVECSQGIMLDSYPGALSQALSHLIFNSVHHGFEDRREGSIQISVGIQGNRLVIDYRDNGKGIPANLAPRIFEPFFTTKRGTHTGLGLSIAWNLVTHLLDGDITRMDSPSPGAAFRITLPLAK